MLLVHSEYFVLLDFTLERSAVVELKMRNKLDEPSASSAEQPQRDGRRHLNQVYSTYSFTSLKTKRRLKLLSNIQINNRKRKQPRENRGGGDAAHAGAELLRPAPRNHRNRSGPLDWEPAHGNRTFAPGPAAEEAEEKSKLGIGGAEVF